MIKYNKSKFKGDGCMFCSKCGKEIDDSAVICVHCGVPTPNFNASRNEEKTPIIINNSSSSSASAAAAAVSGKSRRHYSLFWDIVLTCCTGGLWLIWVVLRPKYD